MVSATSTFEGPEKRLKIVLSSPLPKWRSNDDGHWDRVVNAGKAHIISRISTEALDAYLLSESSLFVWDDRMLMITCGRTTPIAALDVLLTYFDPSTVANFHYERSNFIFPGEQPSNFEEEITPVLARFPGSHQKLGSAQKDHVHIFCAAPDGRSNFGVVPDASLQILMHDLDSSMMDAFCAGPSKRPDLVGKRSNLDRIYPEMQTDSHLFSPYGYSLNGLGGSNYCTVHVTPQREGSYASFETSIVEEDYRRTMGSVLSAFRPERFSLVHRINSSDPSSLWNPEGIRSVSGYHMTKRDDFQSDWGYRVSFMNWAR